MNAGFEPGVPDTKSPADWMLADKPTELSRIKLKTWTRQPVPMISEHSAHLTPLSADFRTWLRRYTYLFLLISMFWHRQAIFKSKGDKLCSSAECRIWTRGTRHQIASRLNARWQTDIHTYIHFCWFNFDALAQGNAYKPTKEPINYRGPGGDRTHDLQTEATPPAASCPARTLHATEIAPKNATPMTCPWLRWTTDNPSGMHRCRFQHLCVLILNCALALAIYIFVGLILMLWHRETNINPQRNR